MKTLIVLALFLWGIGCGIEDQQISNPTNPDIPKQTTLRLMVDAVVPFVWDRQRYDIILTKVSEIDRVAVASFTLHYHPPLPEGVIHSYWITLIQIHLDESVTPTEWQAWNKADTYSTLPTAFPTITVTDVWGEKTPKFSKDDECIIILSQ